VDLETRVLDVLLGGAGLGGTRGNEGGGEEASGIGMTEGEEV